ncbi:MAG: hypothetical protein LBC99_08360 [Spirochaetota bacterium]|nr:hypothetical protein [Spirochaetota bacterium]
MKTLLYILPLIGILLTATEAFPAGIEMPGEETATIRRGIEYLYNLEYEAALTNFASLLPKWQDHPAPWFFTGMVWWIRWSQEDEMKRSGDLLIRNIEVAINKSRALLARNPKDAAGIFYLAGGLGFSGRHALGENNLPRAITTGWEAFQLLQKNTNAFQDDVDVLLGHGIFNFYAGRLPANMRSLAKFLGVQGDWRLGLEQLQQVASNGVFANTEAEVTLSYIYTYDLRDGSTGARYSKNLMDRYPRNPEFRFQYAENLISSGQHDKAKEIAKEGIALAENNTYTNIPRFRLYCILGKASAAERNHEETARWLTLAVNSPIKTSGNYLAWAHVRRGDAYIALGNRRAAEADYKRGLELDGSGSAGTSAEQRLQRMAQDAAKK